MKITVITQDQLMMVDGEALQFSFLVPSGEWAIHFDDQTGFGEVEFIDGRQNKAINSFSVYGYLLDAYHAESARLAEVAAIEQAEAEEAARLEALAEEAQAVEDLK